MSTQRIVAMLLALILKVLVGPRKRPEVPHLCHRHQRVFLENSATGRHQRQPQAEAPKKPRRHEDPTNNDFLHPRSLENVGSFCLCPQTRPTGDEGVWEAPKTVTWKACSEEVEASLARVAYMEAHGTSYLLVSYGLLGAQ